MNKLAAAPDNTGPAMEVHDGVGYTQDPQVKRPAVADSAADDMVLNDTKTAVDIERNPKPKSIDEHDVAEPLKYVVSPADAIEKIEGLLAKVEESLPALRPLVAEVREKLANMEKAVWGQDYEKHEAKEAEPGVEPTKPENTAKFASGDKVTVQVKDETYEGHLTDKNEDGTWEIQTDNQIALHRVSESDIQVGGKDSMMLPASQKRGTAMKELEASLEKLAKAVEAGQTVKAEAYMVFTDDRFPGMEIRNHGGGTFNIYMDGQEVDVFTSYPTQGGGDEKHTMASAQAAADGHFNQMAEEDGQEIEASIFDDVEELDLGGGYVARRKKAGKKEDKGEDKKDEPKDEPKEDKKANPFEKAEEPK